MIQRIKKLKGASIDSLLLTFMQIVTFATGMVTTKLISVALSLEEYGTYSSVNVVISIAASFTLFGLGDCLNYYYNNNAGSPKEKKEQYVNSIYLAQMIIGIVVGIVLLFGKNLIAAYFGNSAVSGLICIVCFKPWLENTIHLYQVLFVSVGRAKIIAFRNFILAVIRIAIVYISLHVFSNLALVFLLLLMVDVIQVITFNRLFAQKNFKVNPLKGKIATFAPIFAYSIPMGVYFVTNTMMREIDKLVIGKLATQTELAIYTNCSKQLPLNLLVTSFATVLVPYIMQYVSEKNVDFASSLFKNYMHLGYLTIWMLSGAIVISAKQVIPFLYSDEYLQGLPVFVIYIIVGMIQFASMHLIVAANGDSNYLMCLSAGILAINAILNIALYYLFSAFDNAMIGPALATVIATAVYTILVLKKSVEILNVPVADLFDVKDLLIYLFQLAIVGIPIYFVKEIVIGYGINRYITMIVACGLYCLIIFAMHIKDYIEILKVINSYKLRNP